MRLAAGNLTKICEKAGLRLSYSAERSVEDELSRESNTDAVTVLLSYLAMLMCVPSCLSSAGSACRGDVAVPVGTTLRARDHPTVSVHLCLCVVTASVSASLHTGLCVSRPRPATQRCTKSASGTCMLS